ncbi:hypothetical protein P8452_50862 [Trifolium repens]|nr:hypothetical protein P8452_50862 [Trifolium repens]
MPLCCRRWCWFCCVDDGYGTSVSELVCGFSGFVAVGLGVVVTDLWLQICMMGFYCSGGSYIGGFGVLLVLRRVDMAQCWVVVVVGVGDGGATSIFGSAGGFDAVEVVMC